MKQFFIILGLLSLNLMNIDGKIYYCNFKTSSFQYVILLNISKENKVFLEVNIVERGILGDVNHYWGYDEDMIKINENLWKGSRAHSVKMQLNRYVLFPENVEFIEYVSNEVIENFRKKSYSGKSRDRNVDSLSYWFNWNLFNSGIYDIKISEISLNLPFDEYVKQYNQIVEGVKKYYNSFGPFEKVSNIVIEKKRGFFFEPFLNINDKSIIRSFWLFMSKSNPIYSKKGIKYLYRVRTNGDFYYFGERFFVVKNRYYSLEENFSYFISTLGKK